MAATSVSVDGGTLEQYHCYYYARDPKGLHVLMSLLTYIFFCFLRRARMQRYRGLLSVGLMHPVDIRGFDVSVGLSAGLMQSKPIVS